MTISYRLIGLKNKGEKALSQGAARSTFENYGAQSHGWLNNKLTRAIPPLQLELQNNTGLYEPPRPCQVSQ